MKCLGKLVSLDSNSSMLIMSPVDICHSIFKFKREVLVDLEFLANMERDYHFNRLSFIAWSFIDDDDVKKTRQKIKM